MKKYKVIVHAHKTSFINSYNDVCNLEFEDLKDINYTFTYRNLELSDVYDLLTCELGLLAYSDSVNICLDDILD